MMDGESDLVLWKTGSQKMETDQVPESELPPVPEDDDLNATVIEVMTDVEVLLDGSSVIDVFAVNSVLLLPPPLPRPPPLPPPPPPPPLLLLLLPRALPRFCARFRASALPSFFPLRSPRRHEEEPFGLSSVHLTNSVFVIRRCGAGDVAVGRRAAHVHRG